MPCKLKNRYSQGEHCFLRSLRAGLARPSSLLLIGVFLLANLLFAYAETHGNGTPPQAVGTSFCHLDSQYDLNSATVEGREFRCGREGAETFSPIKLEFVSSELKRDATLLPGGDDANRSIVSSSLYLTLFCNTPFSPRPPPFFSLQG